RGPAGSREQARANCARTRRGWAAAGGMVVTPCRHTQKTAGRRASRPPPARARPPHLRSFRDGWRHLRFLLLMCPLWLFRVPAMLLLCLGLAVMVWLSPGPRHVAGVTLDVHTMLFGSLCVVVGYQTLWLWGFARLHPS